jgi:elongation factor P
MSNSSQMIPGMTISLNGEIFRIESCVKVSVAKGNPFIKTKLKNLITDETVERNFKLGQEITEVSLSERKLEFLYLEGKDYLFLDVGTLNQILVPAFVIGDRIHYLKEGVDVKAMCYGESIFSVELPQFLELMVAKTEAPEAVSPLSNATKVAVLETGAEVDVPLFIEAGDIVKVDTYTKEYIQRV